DGIRERNVTGVQTCALPIARPLSPQQKRQRNWPQVLMPSSTCSLPTPSTRQSLSKPLRAETWQTKPRRHINALLTVKLPLLKKQQIQLQLSCAIPGQAFKLRHSRWKASQRKSF